MSSLVKFFLHPFNIFWLLLFASAISYFFKREKLFKPVFIFTCLWLLVTSNFIVPGFLVSSLESKYEPFSKEKVLSDSVTYNIVVLGAGFTNNPKLPYNDQLAPNALSRLIEGIRIYKMLPKSKLVVSGPGYPGKITQAEVFLKTAVSLGVPPTDISIINTATNTNEEAIEYSKNYNKTTPVILVTNAFHMQRAVMMFNNKGINPIPAPTGYLIKSTGESFPYWFPSEVNMLNMQTALNEYTGILYAKWFLF
ncbi:MAG: YdcF family protein [Bacteroidetes bacterium]|nr:YdcF family protein [Bacteroidota bacterium]